MARDKDEDGRPDSLQLLTQIRRTRGDRCSEKAGMAIGGLLEPALILVMGVVVLLSEFGVIKRVELAVPAKSQPGADLSPNAPDAVTPSMSSARPTAVVPAATNGLPQPIQQGPQPAQGDQR